MGRLRKQLWRAILPGLLLPISIGCFGVTNCASAANPEYGSLYSPGGSNPIPVSIQLEIENIPRLDEVAEQFSVDGALLATWKDPNLTYQRSSPSEPDRIYQVGSIWMPSLDMVNAVTPREKRYRWLTVSPDGTVHFEERFHADLSSRFMLRRFPFDAQSLSIHLSPFVNDISAETLVIAPEPSRVRSEEKSYNSLAQWNVDRSIATRTGTYREFKHSASELVFSIQVKRRYGFYIWKVFVPLLLMVFLSWAVFWIDPVDLSNQVQIAVTTILTVIAFAFAISATMPRVPYMTFIDAFFLACYIFVFIAVVELMTVHTAHRRHGPDASLRIRRVSRWLVPAAYATTIAILVIDFLG